MGRKRIDISATVTESGDRVTFVTIDGHTGRVLYAGESGDVAMKYAKHFPPQTGLNSIQRWADRFLIGEESVEIEGQKPTKAAKPSPVAEKPADKA